MVVKKWSELSPAQKKKVQAIMEEQEDEDVELGDPDETVVETENKGGKRILVIEGPAVDDMLRQLGISEDEVEDDVEDIEEEEKPKRKPRAKKEAELEEDELEEEPKPKPRSRYFGGNK